MSKIRSSQPCQNEHFPKRSSAGITPPDPKQTRPMFIRLKVSNTAGQSAALELKVVDVSGCYKKVLCRVQNSRKAVWKRINLEVVPKK